MSTRPLGTHLFHSLIISCGSNHEIVCEISSVHKLNKYFLANIIIQLTILQYLAIQIFHSAKVTDLIVIPVGRVSILAWPRLTGSIAIRGQERSNLGGKYTPLVDMYSSTLRISTHALIDIGGAVVCVLAVAQM